jgi:hypothetical protein
MEVATLVQGLEAENDLTEVLGGEFQGEYFIGLLALQEDEVSFTVL